MTPPSLDARLALAAAALLLVLCPTGRGQDDAGLDERPNILVILTDQQHGGMLSSAGAVDLRTPAMDALARAGVRFEKAFATNPASVPSRVSMITGLLPGRLGFTDNNTSAAEVSEAVVDGSLGRLLQGAGYDSFFGGREQLPAELKPRRSGFGGNFQDARGMLAGTCARFLSTEREAPFFLVASFKDPNDIRYAQGAQRGETLHKKSKVLKLYQRGAARPDDALPGLPANFEIPQGEPDRLGEVMLPDNSINPLEMRAQYDEREWRLYRWLYRRLTERVDKEIGDLLGAVRHAGVADNTLIIFLSVHGDMDGAHRLASSGTFYEESVHVPFVMRFDGVIPPGRVDREHLVSAGVDLFATICDYAQIPLPEGRTGRSLRALAEGVEGPDGDEQAWRDAVVSENGAGRMLRTGRHKYCVYASGDVRESLVDLVEDPGEMHNLAGDPAHAATLEGMRARLAAWMAETGDEQAARFTLTD